LIVQSTGRFATALFVGAAIALVAALLYAVLVGNPITLKQDAPLAMRGPAAP
jgi:hypothetical protein